VQSNSVKCLTLGRDERWYLVHALPRRERQAAAHLEMQGFRPYLPQITRTVRHARQLRTVSAPLFPRYLFVRLDLDRDAWLSVRSTVGVSHIVSCEGRPIPVPVGIVESLIEHCGDRLSLLGDGLTRGQPVRILSGPFADFVGLLDRLDQNGRVRILLDMMGTAIQVDLHRSTLAPAA